MGMENLYLAFLGALWEHFACPSEKVDCVEVNQVSKGLVEVILRSEHILRFRISSTDFGRTHGG